jgi:cytochrome c5
MTLEKAVYFLSLSFGAASLAFVIAGAPPAAASAAAPAPREPQAIWDKLCKSCHGTDGRGNPEKAKTLKIDAIRLNLGREGTEKMTKDELKAIVLEGKEKMPAYKTKVKEDEIDALVGLAETIAEGARKTP